MQEHLILRATMQDRAHITRQTADKTGTSWGTVYDGIPCALSRSAKVSSPDPGTPAAALREGIFRATLFLPAGTVTHTGDQAVILRQGVSFSGVLSASVPYVSHSVAVILIQEVTEQ